jgi:hypothetical protein
MVSALLIFRRFVRAVRYAVREEDFLPEPELVLQQGWLKIYTIFFQLIGIGILVEILRRLGAAFVAVRQQERPGSDQRV